MPKVGKKQPETRLRRLQPDRKVKRRSETMVDPEDGEDPKSKSFDMIGGFIHNGPGANVVCKIFSHMNFSTFQQARLVCKSWNHFLGNDRMLLLNWLMRSKHYDNLKETWPIPFEFWKEYLEHIKNDVNLNYQKVFQIFGKVMSIVVVSNMIQNLNPITYTLTTMYLKHQLIGLKLFSQIERKVIQIKRKFYQVEGKFCHDPFLEWLFKKMMAIEALEDEQEAIEEKYSMLIDTDSEDEMGENDLSEARKLEIQRDWDHDIQIMESRIESGMQKIREGVKKELYSDVNVKIPKK